MDDNTLSADFQHVYQLNIKLLEMARDEQWEHFSQTAEIYIITLQTMLERHRNELNADGKQGLKEKLSELLSNENEMTGILKRRLDVLKENMSSLGRGTRCNQAYTEVFSSASSYH